MSKLTDSIPTSPQDWNRNPQGFVRHQKLLVKLVTWLEEQGAEVQIPEDRNGWDLGIDLIVNGLRIDLKSFGLGAYGKSLTWKSEYYRGRPAPIYDGTETDWFVHPTDGPVSEWIAADRESLRTSKYGYAPYYFQSDVIDMGSFVAC